MALSDEERRRLEELAQELAAADPDLAEKLQKDVPHSRGSARAVYGALTALAGLALVIAGIITKLTLIGYLLMIAGTHWFLSDLNL